MEVLSVGVSVKSIAPIYSCPILTNKIGELSITLLNIVMTQTRMKTVVTPM